MTLVEREALVGRIGIEGGAPSAFAVEAGLSFAELSADWSRLEAEGAATPYQTLSWVRRWSETIGAADGADPSPVVWRDSGGRVVGILPLCVLRRGGLRIAAFMGGKHANYAMGLFDPRLASRLTPDDVAALLGSTARAAGVDLFRLCNQPFAWNGFENPLALLPRQRSATSAWKRDLHADGESLIRGAMSPESCKKLRRKERKLAEIGLVSYIEATTEAEAAAVLEAFFAQKAKRFAAQGIPDPFASESVRSFIRAASRPVPGGAPISLFALRVGDRIAAQFGGVVHAGRFSGMFTSFDDSPDIARCSPGDLLIVHLMRMLGERGLRAFDLGAGDSPYKRQFCPDEEALFDTILPISIKGRAAAWAIGAALAAKGAAKRSPLASRLIARARRLRAR